MYQVLARKSSALKLRGWRAPSRHCVVVPFTGKVLAVSWSQLELELPFKPGRLHEQTWRLEKLGNLVTFERCTAALQKLSNMNRGYNHSTAAMLYYPLWLLLPDPPCFPLFV